MFDPKTWKSHTSTIPSLFKVDIESKVGEHDIIFLSAPENWQEGAILGNGDMTLNLFYPHPVIFGVGKVDIWDIRSLRAEHPFHKHSEYLEAAKKGDEETLERFFRDECVAYCGNPFPQPKPAGLFCLNNIKPVRGKYFLQRLSLGRAEVTAEYDAPKRLRLRAFVSAEENVAVLTIEGPSEILSSVGFFLTPWEFPADPWVMKFDLFSWDRSLRQGKASSLVQGNDLLVTRTLPGGVSWTLAARVPSGIKAPRICDSTVDALAAADGRKLVVYLSVVTSNESSDTTGAVRALLDKAEKEGVESIRKRHRRWWRGFWKESLLDLGDKFIENLWYFQNYLFASCSRGAVPPSLQSPWMITPYQGWNGDYHNNTNLQMMYYLPLVGNHLELGLPFLQTFFGNLEVAKCETREAFEMNGVKFPMCTTPSGEEIVPGYWRYEIYVSAWLAELFWRYYEFSRDEDFLRDRAYPVLKECASFQAQFMERGEDGKFHIYPTRSVEHGAVMVRDQTIDLAFAKILFDAAIKAAEIVDDDGPHIYRWKEILCNIVDYPQTKTRVLAHAGASPDYPLHHPITALAPLFPGEEAGLGQEGPLTRKLAHNFGVALELSCRKGGRETFPFKKVPSQMDDIGHQYLSVAAARLGRKDLTWAYLYDLLILQFLKRNGFLACVNPFHVRPQRDRSFMPWIMSLDCGFTVALNEMLIQGHSGFIRLFPGIPDNQDAAIVNFRSAGGFLVSAVKKGAKVRFAVITSTAGGPCRVVSPWGKSVRLTAYPGEEAVPFKVASDVISFETEKGSTYLLRPLRTRKISPVKLAGRYRTKPRLWLGPSYFEKPPLEKRWKIYLGWPPLGME